jgi:nucleoside-diphosphate-sugar epimerase
VSTSERWLVTGGAGYLGRFLVQRLQSAGLDVRVFDLAPSGIPGIDGAIGDVRDFAAVQHAMAGVTHAIHAAAQVPLARNNKAFESVNVQGTRHVVHAARQAGVASLVVVSSSAVYGIPQHNPVTESTPPMPCEAYGRSKAAADAMALVEAGQSLPVSIVRPRTVVGPGRLGLFSVLFNWIARGEAIPVLGDGGNRYQFVHPEDVADLCVQAGMACKTGIYLAGAPGFSTLADDLEWLCAHAGTGSRVVPVPRAPLEVAMRWAGRLHLAPLADYHAALYGRSLWFDTAGTETALDWQPRWTQRDLLADAWRWHVDHGQDRQAGPGRHQRPVPHALLDLGWRLGQRLARLARR